MLKGGKSWKFSGAVPQELKARIVCGNGGATAVMPCDLACSGQTGALRERRGSPMDNPKVKMLPLGRAKEGVSWARNDRKSCRAHST